jgi:hypothetical protein
VTTPGRFQMILDGRSRMVVVAVNDVSDFVMSVDVPAEPHGLPFVVLQLAPDTAYPASLDLSASVYIGTASDPGPAAAEFPKGGVDH